MSPLPPAEAVDPHADADLSPEDAFAAFIGDDDDEPASAPAPKAKSKPKPADPEIEDADDLSDADEDLDPLDDEEEEPAADEEEDETTEEEDDDEEVRDPKKLLAMAEKRKKQRDKARAELASLTQELDTLRQAQPAAPLLLPPTPENPVSHVSFQDLPAAEAEWKRELAWCQQHIAEGAERPGPNGTPVEWTPEKVRRRMDQCLDVLQQHLPAQKQFLAEFQTDVKEVGEKYAFLQTPAIQRELADFGEAVIQQAPGIVRHPRHVSLIARAFIADKLLSGKFRAVTGADKRVNLVPVTGTSDGTGKPKVVKPAVARPVRTTPAAPPARRATKEDITRQRVANASSAEAAFLADLEASFE